MFGAYFQHRNSRIIAALRLVLAIIFLTALIADPGQPYRAPVAGYAIMVAYVAFAAVLLRVAWTSWWYDFRLSVPAFVIDISVFSLSVLFTEGTSSGFNSPFTAFYFFIMFSASLRWDSKTTALSAIAAAVGYLIAGLALIAVDKDLDLQIFLRRLSYMGVIGLAFVLAGFEARRGRRQATPSDLLEFDAIDAAVRHAARQLGATTVAIAREYRDEPAVAAFYRDGSVELRRLPTARIDATEDVRLFDRSRGRMLLQRGPGERVQARSGPVDIHLAEEAGVVEGLDAILRSGQGAKGELVAGGMANFAIDDLERMRDVARDVVVIIEERALAELERNRAVVQTREALARDLHDSVAQALAGTSFGVEALRQTIPAEAVEAQRLATELKASLRSEQAHIREMIDRLRLAPDDQSAADLAVELGYAVEECRRRWAIDIELEIRDNREIGAPLAFECRQIVREAVSNAVRHGGARRIEICAQGKDDGIMLAIANDGAPFDSDIDSAQPWTIRERVVRLKGEMQVANRASRPNLQISLPAA